jgi:adenylylsulfate kinase-like enzyme
MQLLPAITNLPKLYNKARAGELKNFTGIVSPYIRRNIMKIRLKT